MVLINGHWQDALPASDRGLLYGDGLFETFACRGGKALLWEEHLLRLRAGCRRLGLPLPDGRQLADERDQALACQPDGVLKLIYTRGTGGRGYAPPRSATAQRLFSLHPLPSYPAAWWEGGVRLRLCELTLAQQPRLAGIKHLNRLEQVLARAEWREPDIAEGLMLDTSGTVVEGTFTNVYACFGDTVETPLLDRCGVRGVMRQRVLEQGAATGMRVIEGRLSLARLRQADALWLSNSLIGLWPVREFDGTTGYRPGGAMRQLQRALASACGFSEEMLNGGA